MILIATEAQRHIVSQSHSPKVSQSQDPPVSFNEEGEGDR